MKQAIDIADFLQRRVIRDDFVVVKMDVEGAEYSILPHLVMTRSIFLIDELFVEIHTGMNTCCKNRKDRKFGSARQLLLDVRSAGVYGHMWA